MYLNFLLTIRRKNALLRNRDDCTYHGFSTCPAGGVTLPFPVCSCAWSFPLLNATGGTLSHRPLCGVSHGV